jgi:hypothetical protein
VSYSKIILKDRPDIVWPLDDINESSSVSNPINFYSGSITQYSASISASLTTVLDIPIIFGGGTALKLSSSANPNITIPLLGKFSELYQSKESSLEFWIRCDKVPSTEIPIAKKKNNSNIGLYLKNNYLILRYGNSSKYVEASYGLAELTEPTHIVMNQNKSSIELIVNGVSIVESIEKDARLEIDASHATNDYMDFYGSTDFNILIDSIALYSFNVKQNTAKSHYVYGLGKSINQSIFIGLGGEFYNLASNRTRKSFYANWDSVDDWSLTRYDNLINTNDGIRPNYYNDIEIDSVDGKYKTTNNSVSFTSSIGDTTGTYFDIEDLPTIIKDGSNPFFVKIKFDGNLPIEGKPQTVISLGKKPQTAVLDFNFTKISGDYFLVAKNNIFNGSVSFKISDVTSSPTAYVGMRFENQAIFYFAQSGSLVQSASLTSFSGSQFGVDDLSFMFPPNLESVIRIGAANTFDLSSNVSNTIDRRQFYGTFLQYLSAPNNFSPASYSEINSFNKPVYSIEYDTTLSRFRTKVYGNANFILHGSKIGEPANSGSVIISGNRFEFGYPDSISSSQVLIYASLYDYSDNLVYPKTKLNKIDSLSFINLVNLNNKYLKFDIDILSDDATNYPPVMKYFKVDTYPYSGSYISIVDDCGSLIKINNSSTSSAQAYAPEIESTPSILITDYSGIRVYNNTVDFTFSPISKSFNPASLNNLLMWYDGRFANGLGKDTHLDGTASQVFWRSLSGSAITASVVSSTNNPEYRRQSLNILTINQMNGAESGSVTRFTASSASIQSSTELSISGDRSIKVIPDETSSLSFLRFFMDTSASSRNRFLFPSQTYTVVGTINVPKQQSIEIAESRRIGIYAASSGPFGILGSFLSASVPNAIGAYSSSVTFTVPQATDWLDIRFYNGSSSSLDPVYWDNMGIYTGSVISGSPSVFYQPMQVFDDRPVYKFNGIDKYFVSTASIQQQMTVYIVGRSFGDNSTFIGKSASAPSIYTESNTFRMGAGNVLIGPSVNTNFNIIVGVFNGNSSSLFVNSSVVSGNAGTGSYSSDINIGYRQTPTSTNSYLSGDIASVLVFNTNHSNETVTQIIEWMKDAFNISY